MSSSSRTVPDLLGVARRSIEEFPSFALVEDLRFSQAVNKWVLCFDAEVATSTAHIPKQTRWWMHIDPRYPWGDIEVYPDKVKGITATFYHQDLNLEGETHEAWRTGDICVRVPSFAVGRRQFDEDPVGQPERMQWYFERVIYWLNAASTQSLVTNGEPFELPQFKPKRGVVGYLAEPYLNTPLPTGFGRAGVTEFAVLKAEPLQLAVTNIRAFNGEQAIEVTWGKRVSEAKARATGLWLFLNCIPILEPYRAAITWGDLRRIFREDVADLDTILMTTLGPLRDDFPHFGLLGFPIPKVFGGPNVQLHWQAFRLPQLSCGEKFQKGFRKGPNAYWMRDRANSFRDSDTIEWLDSENWSSEEMGTRGQLPSNIRSRSVSVIGVGAVGAPLAELLVRGGLKSISVVDGDFFQAGNTVRHTLLMDDVESAKANRVAARLNRINLLVNATPILARFPHLDDESRELFRASDIIVDCTGEDDVVASLSEETFESEKWFWSISLSLGAKRVYAFLARGKQFSVEDFHQKIGPWVERDRGENMNIPLPRQGTGCWHPVFPASPEEVSLMVAAALRYLSDATSKNQSASSLAVFERQVRGDVFSGLARVDDEQK